MAKQKKPKAVQCNIRLAAEIRDDLKTAASKNGVSFNAEIAKRIGKSFAEEEIFGGPDGRHMVYLMASAFLAAGQKQAGTKTISQWINDPDSYGSAFLAVAETLLAQVDDLERRALLVEALKGRVATAAFNSGSRS